MKHSSIKNKNYILFESLGIFFIFILWIVGSSIVDKEYVFPKVLTVGKALITLFKSGNTYYHILSTVLRIVLSLLISFLIGILLGALASVNNSFYYFMSPIIKILRALPIVSIILIIFVLIGNKDIGMISFSPILISSLVIVPIVYESVYGGIINIDKDLIDVSRIYTDKKKDRIKYVYLPLIKSNIKTSLSQSIGLAFKSMVMAEYISQSRYSIGNALQIAKANLEYDVVFSWTIILIVLAILFEFIGKTIMKER